MIWVDPGLPLKQGDDALFMERSGGKRVFLGEFRRVTDSEIVCINYHDRKERRYSRTHWRAFHVFGRY